MKIKTILVPTDFSDAAGNALHLAAALARRSDADLLLLHVIELPIGSPVAPNHRESSDAYLPHKLAETKEKLRLLSEIYPDLHIRKHVVLDDEGRALADFVTEEVADLIVLGTKEDGRLEKTKGSGTIEKIIRMAQVPVFTVKSPMNATSLANIVFASNFKEVPGRVVENLKAIQELFGSVVHFVKIVPPRVEVSTQRETLDVILDFATRHEFDHYTFNIYIGESKEVAIRKFAESVKADLIAMSISGRDGIAHFLFGNLTEKMANTSNQSMLTLCE